jgi:hypothetical protein
MPSQQQLEALLTQLEELKRSVGIYNADVHFYNRRECALTIRADELCAAAQPVEWELDRMGAGKEPRVAAPSADEQEFKPDTSFVRINSERSPELIRH